MEGKDWPHGHRQKDFRLLGNNVGRMLRMCEQIFGPVRCVIFDSVFYVVEGVIAFGIIRIATTFVTCLGLLKQYIQKY